MAAILGGGATAHAAQFPFLSSDVERAAAGLTIEPLHGRAGKGLLPPHMENGAILSRECCPRCPAPNGEVLSFPILTCWLVGPTFINPIYENSTDTDLGSCWGCAVTIAKELPCIYQAIKTVSVSALLNCGVAKPDVSRDAVRLAEACR